MTGSTDIDPATTTTRTPRAGYGTNPVLVPLYCLVTIVALPLALLAISVWGAVTSRLAP